MSAGSCVPWLARRHHPDDIGPTGAATAPKNCAWDSGGCGWREAGDARRGEPHTPGLEFFFARWDAVAVDMAERAARAIRWRYPGRHWCRVPHAVLAAWAGPEKIGKAGAPALLDEFGASTCVMFKPREGYGRSLSGTHRTPTALAGLSALGRHHTRSTWVCGFPGEHRPRRAISFLLCAWETLPSPRHNSVSLLRCRRRLGQQRRDPCPRG